MVFLLIVSSDQRLGELAASTDKRARGSPLKRHPAPLFGLPRHNPAVRKKSRGLPFFFKQGLVSRFGNLALRPKRKQPGLPKTRLFVFSFVEKREP
jgi:hypothetical protein